MTSCWRTPRAATRAASSATKARPGSSTWTRSAGSHGGREFVWVSEKDGWRHAYAVKRDGSGERLLTKFDGDLGLDYARSTRPQGNLYFIASPTNATQRYLYAARLDGDGSVRRITPDEPARTHTATTFRPTAAGRCTRGHHFQSPPKTEIVDAARPSIGADADRQRGRWPAKPRPSSTRRWSS